MSKLSNSPSVGVNAIVRLPTEEILGLEKQPEQSCPEIDKTVKDVRLLLGYIKDALRSIQYEDWEGTKYAVEYIEFHAGDLEDYFEYCRSQCDSIRAWGQDWKDLAKRLIKEHEPELLEQTEVA